MEYFIYLYTFEDQDFQQEIITGHEAVWLPTNCM